LLPASAQELELYLVIMLGNFGKLSLNLLMNLQRAHESQSRATIKAQLDKYGREQVNQTVLAVPINLLSGQPAL
jgi:hypothetical protein